MMESQNATAAPREVGQDLRTAQLNRYGLLAVTGDDACAFLHAQLTSDIANLARGQARLAGWCSAKGRLLANFLVLPRDEGYFLVVARDLVPVVAKRLAMFVLRSKVKVADASESEVLFGIWGPAAAARLSELGLSRSEQALSIFEAGGLMAVRMGDEQYLVVAPASQRDRIAEKGDGDESQWALLEIRAGRPWVTLPTQDLFVPQMINFEAIGGVDFRKGCYPGQEIVARTQYRGQLKRRMIRARAPAGVSLQPGQNLYSDAAPGQANGTVVNVAPADEGSELLAVVQIGAGEEQAQVLAATEGPALERLPIPYAP